MTELIAAQETFSYRFLVSVKEQVRVLGERLPGEGGLAVG